LMLAARAPAKSSRSWGGLLILYTA